MAGNELGAGLPTWMVCDPDDVIRIVPDFAEDCAAAGATLIAGAAWEGLEAFTIMDGSNHATKAGNVTPPAESLANNDTAVVLYVAPPSVAGDYPVTCNIRMSDGQHRSRSGLVRVLDL